MRKIGRGVILNLGSVKRDNGFIGSASYTALE
jgi:hypothetical protein